MTDPVSILTRVTVWPTAKPFELRLPHELQTKQPPKSPVHHKNVTKPELPRFSLKEPAKALPGKVALPSPQRLH
jgi:hypothetical protein